eukprot:CAMPEP_0172675736 /NCGR_PEP_ID=MMETSP1074-20121228/13454_1 /TAXON_ID=2916 /ORGANISM="Ceratium fusus, Strain PA161109" /LENGTH=116 /DNA_ID=CAMNT_0013493233 /DNA_START=343 /DNA_END=693 /DNA_ORIENTATION=+
MTQSVMQGVHLDKRQSMQDLKMSSFICMDMLMKFVSKRIWYGGLRLVLYSKNSADEFFGSSRTSGLFVFSATALFLLPCASAFSRSSIEETIFFSLPSLDFLTFLPLADKPPIELG